MLKISADIGRHVKKTVTMAMIFIMALSLLAGCGGGSEDPDEPTKAKEVTLSGEVKIAYPDDLAYATGVLEAMPKDYKVFRQDDSEAVARKLASGEADLALMTPEDAARLFADSPSIRCVCPVFLGGYRIVGALGRISLMESQYEEEEPVTEEEDTEEGAGEDDNESDSAFDAAQTAEEEEERLTPSMLRRTTINVVEDENKDLEYLADVAMALDGGTEFNTRELEDMESVKNYLSNYNATSIVNVCQLAALKESLPMVDNIVDLDAFWQERTGQPLPSVVLVVRVGFLKDRPDEINVVIRDYEKTFAEMEQPYEEGRLVFYGSSNRGQRILESYYENVFSDRSRQEWIPDAVFYDIVIDDSQSIGS